MKYISLTHDQRTIVDDSDYDWLMQWKWAYGGDCYARRTEVIGSRKDDGGRECNAVYMHRMILKPPKGMQIDHINGNRLDNRRDNMRICTPSQNMYNKEKTTNKKSSIFKGVHRPKTQVKWKAQIRRGNGCGKTKHLGSFTNEVDAAQAYNEAAIEEFGEFAKLNDLTLTREKLKEETILIQNKG